jgi:hypothetical protein
VRPHKRDEWVADIAERMSKAAAPGRLSDRVAVLEGEVMGGLQVGALLGRIKALEEELGGRLTPARKRYREDEHGGGGDGAAKQLTNSNYKHK